MVCEPVERANSNHLFTAGLADSMGVRKKPMRVYSVVKYAAIACGDAEVFMKFAQSRYKEKIWAHAAGVVIVEEAGGVVTDAGGRNLDFSKGVYLEGLDRGIIACSGQVLHDKLIGAVNCMFATMHHMYVCYNASREEESKVGASAAYLETGLVLVRRYVTLMFSSVLIITWLKFWFDLGILDSKIPNWDTPL
ncbi:PAP-specific phosphatase HAL2-like [Raphanus sativus]|nr:PAP-specific phosphatase HAL2-like [Raphanus sativus]